MPLLTLALAGAAAATTAAQAPPPQQRPIVVTGRRLNLKAALERCLARNCPTPEDVDATLAYAEELFVEGDYEQAREAIKASLARNKDKAKTYPEPVADLYRSDARVSRHLGRDEDAQRSMRQIYYALKAGISVLDYRHFTARLEMASSDLAFGKYEDARAELARLQADARAAGRDDVAQIAQLRSLWVDYLESGSTGGIEHASRAADPREAILATGAKVLLGRIYREKGDVARSEAIFATIRSKNRMLLCAPPYELAVHEVGLPPSPNNPIGLASAINALDRVSGSFSDAWMDVGFSIAPDGTVHDVEILKHGSSTDWAAPVLRSIRGRRYSASIDNQPTYRRERYTYTAGYEVSTGSRMRRRSPRARVEYFNLDPQ
jgi:tetratricopeptide (TPR) repeat protein